MGIALAAAVVLAGCAGIGDPSASPRAGPTGGASPSPAPGSPNPDDPWAPASYPEDGRRVMPVTFPDGTTAELVYRPELALDELSVYPDTFAQGGPRACGLPVYATRYHPRDSWVQGEGPLAQHVRPDGKTVALWQGSPDHRPYDYLVYRFGSWWVLVPCRGSVDQDALTTWADNLHGRESPEGLLVLEGTGPFVLHPWRDQNGPTLRMSDRDLIIDVRPLSEQCDQDAGWGRDTDNRDGVVQWCVQPEGGIYVYANGFTARGNGLLDGLVRGLEVRAVRPSH